MCQRTRRWDLLDVAVDARCLEDADQNRKHPRAVDLAQRASGQVPRPAAAGPVDPLTTREQVVLRYLASSLSNAEIAAELYVSVNTVNTHVRSIYSKLDARDRSTAVERARELRLLSASVTH